MNENETRSEKLPRRITAWGIWLLAVNGLIGAGIFGAPGDVAALVGIYSPLLILVCGLLIATVVLCFCELSSYFRGTGGPVMYIQTAFGGLAGFQTGWAFYIARVTAFAANINLLATSIAYFWAPVGQGAGRVALMGSIVALLAWVNVVGIKQAMSSLGLLTVLKFIPLLLLVIVGLFWLEPAVFPVASTPLPSMMDFGTAALLVVYAFVGWEAAVIPAGETRNPARAMPRALLWAIGTVTLLYVLVQAVVVAVLPELAGGERALIEAGGVLLGPFGALLLTVGVVVSVGGNAAGTMVTAPRLTYSMAREGGLPAWLGKVHPRYRTPSNSVILLAVLVFILAVYGSFVWLAAMSALVRVMIYMGCIASMPRLRRRFGDAQDRFSLPWGWTIPIVAFAASALLLIQVQPMAVMVTGLCLLVGAVLYWAVRRRV